MNTLNDILALDAKHHIRYNTPIGKSAEIAIVRGSGVWLYDTEGNRYLDGRSQLNCVNLGHGNKAIIRAIQEQAETLQYASTFYQYTHPQAATCAARLAGLLPGALNHVAFTSGGSEANELALSLARLYWSRVKPSKIKVISRFNGYHGNTSAAMSATGMAMGGQPGMQMLVSGHVHINPPYQYRSGIDDPHVYARHCADTLAQAIEWHGPDTVGAFIAEPIIGVGGYMSPPPGYWKSVGEVCDRYDVLLIIDEIMTGFCRTGAMFASDLFEIQPDMLTMGKGINSTYVPCGAVGVADKIIEAIEGAVLSGFTNAGHPLAMAAVHAALDIYEDDDIAAHVQEISDHITQRLRREFSELPIVGDIDGAGLMLGIEIVADKTTKAKLPAETVARITSEALKRGLITRGKGSRMSLCPPLIIERDEADIALDIMFEVLKGLVK